ncbi:MAG: cytochrome c class [Gemmatimonadetes bacterium]|nr:cytochrome c class [Gemmatimonadota bacterium]
MRRPLRKFGSAFALVGAAAAGGLAISCGSGVPTQPKPEQLDPALVSAGKDIFRFDTFGDEKYWTDTLRMHEVIQSAVSPAAALSVGFKVDVDSVPRAVRDAIAAGTVDLASPATTVTLLKLNAVVGLKGDVRTINGRDTLARVGITCALCHSTVDNSFAKGIGHRLDGWPNMDMNAGAIVALSPAVSPALKTILNSWGPGKYDPRINLDGLSTPLVLPPAYGLAGVDKVTYTAEGSISYWNAYVAVTQMHGQGSFSDPRIGVNVLQTPDLVTPKLTALRQYQLSLGTPKPPAGTVDDAAEARGRALFNGAANCASCHLGTTYTDVNFNRLHAPSETGMDPRYAARTADKAYRTTPLRGLLQHAPYFHDGSAATLAAVVDHYDGALSLRLSSQQKHDLVEYLKTL